MKYSRQQCHIDTTSIFNGTFNPWSDFDFTIQMWCGYLVIYIKNANPMQHRPILIPPMTLGKRHCAILNLFLTMKTQTVQFPVKYFERCTHFCLKVWHTIYLTTQQPDKIKPLNQVPFHRKFHIYKDTQKFIEFQGGDKFNEILKMDLLWIGMDSQIPCHSPAGNNLNTICIFNTNYK